MNKKLMMGGALGLVALGAGVFALSGFGGDSDDSPARVARAEASGRSMVEPYPFPSFGDFVVDYTNIQASNSMKVADAGKPEGGPDVQAPAAGSPVIQAQPEDDKDEPPAPGGGESEDDEAPATPEGDPSQGVPPAPADGGNGGNTGGGIIYHQGLIDSLCKLLGCGSQPVVDPTGSIADAISDAAGAGNGNGNGPTMRPCDVVGNCVEDEPDIPIIKFGPLFSPKH